MEGGCGDDVDAEEVGETVAVQVEGVLGREEPFLVRVKGARVLHHVDIFRGPACRYVSNHDLLQQWPVAREAYVETRALRHVGRGRFVPRRDRR